MAFHRGVVTGDKLRGDAAFISAKCALTSSSSNDHIFSGAATPKGLTRYLTDWRIIISAEC
jgi:hypothetical protein